MALDYNNKIEKDPNRQIQGARSKAVGNLFEQIIDISCIHYKRKKVALIEKTPEPMKPIRSLGKGRFVACFEKQAQPDYKGTLNNGQAIIFEAKHTDKEQIEQSRLTDEQMELLGLYSEMGAICFILVSIGMEKFYRIPWEVWRDMKVIYNRKHMKLHELEDYKVTVQNGLIMLLEGIVG